MGVVYTPEAVNRGGIPEVGEHYETGEQVFEHFGDQESISLVMIHGSVAERRENIRSDLDVLILYDRSTRGGDACTIAAIRHTLEQIQFMNNVTIEAKVWPADESADLRYHRLQRDRMYGQHLAEAMDNLAWTRGDEDDGLLDLADRPIDPTELKQTLISYAMAKQAKFSAAPAALFGEEDAFKAFQRALELPNAYLRKLGQFMTLTGQVEGRFLPDIQDVGVDAETMHAVESLQQANSTYTDLLEWVSSLEQPISRNNLTIYHEWLHREYPRALRLGMAASIGLTDHAVRL